ncbi:hypothetical protein J2W22_000914 [Sphingomonas kyeonggiensis]|uniref:hypothetical protein n=1 Tax=Sphingomonas kyeonggiensis TaxID=1268553 RepID=UPI00277FAB8F|nr:hypothetical protein [Sphingomonas kyeonggiensis]MDQ0248867.1 hypothetical protein [Sphingomonas kyeonggiensis]
MPDHWEEGGRDGHPLIATLAGAAVLVLAALLGPRFATPLPLPALLIGGAAAGLVLWLIGFAITTRHASLAWKLGSLVLLIGAGAGAAAIAHGQFQTQSRADASSFAEIELAPDGAVILPAGVRTRGPVSQLYADAVQADAAAARAFLDAQGKFGMGALTSPYLLQQNPHAIGNCGEIEQLRALAAEQSLARTARRSALAEAIGSASLPKAAKLGIARIAGDTKEDALLANQQAMLDATAELCTLLARRSWYNDNGYFGFHSGADAAAFTANKAKRQTLAEQADAVAAAAKTRILDGREQVRDALSRSIYTKD